VRACDVEIGEVGAVGLVKIIVAFHEWGVRGRYYREEEGRRRDGWGDVGKAEEAVSEEGVEDAEVPCEWNILEICKEEECCYYPRIAAGSCECVDEELPDAHSGGRDAERE